MLRFKRFLSPADRRNKPIFCYDCLQYTMEGLTLNAKPQYDNNSLNVSSILKFCDFDTIEHHLGEETI